MVSPVINEQYYTGGFMVSEAPGTESRDLGTIANAGTVDLLIEGGQVLSQALIGTPTITAAGGNHGNGTLGTSVAAENNAITGNYTLIANSASVFAVYDPNGTELAPANVGTAYSEAEIAFQITAGSTAFAAADAFTIDLPPGSGNYVSYTGAAGQPAVGICYNRAYIPASGSRTVTVITRNAEVNSAELQWDPAVINSGSVAALEASALAALRTRGIIAR